MLRACARNIFKISYMRRTISHTAEKNTAYDGRKWKIGIVVSMFHADLTERMLDGARAELRKHGVKERNSTVISVPGTFEIPLACQHLARTKKYDALIAIGCVIKGETDHYNYVAGEGIRGIMDVMLAQRIPIGLAVLTTHTLAHAAARAGGTENAGQIAARSVLHVLSSFSKNIVSPKTL